MANKRANAFINHKGVTHHINMPILTWKEDGIFYIYSPFLDLTGYGTSEQEAKDSFKITLTEFVKYMENKGTTYEELKRLGWTVNEKKKRVHPPEYDQLLEDNDTFRDLTSMPGVVTDSTNIEIALA
ncbi:hypothetical protein FW774_19540 [Pedobacter sp. BS3]|uniref:hypothetical protein n=1 Tax=Pedobacter sp. BS3 TaxID=2567937 RepID=UPI0011ED687A|nr:hypothetical protein [Pedobacter sp. BS3]TZF81044.1 hypothetical protein FW774_19540 [Pedobacter sp. BS3]